MGQGHTDSSNGMGRTERSQAKCSHSSIALLTMPVIGEGASDDVEGLGLLRREDVG